MSLEGRLEDVSVADVMQFIHLGRRTGTLRIEGQNDEGHILFHAGSIVGARLRSGERIGELLVSLGSLTLEQRDRALEDQHGHHSSLTLGQILLDLGVLDIETVQSAIRHQIEATIYEVVGWSNGSFQFRLDHLEPIDEISFLPADLIPELDLNTQMILLEAARVFDEKHRRDQGGSEEIATHASDVHRLPHHKPPTPEERLLDRVQDLSEGLDQRLAEVEPAAPVAATRARLLLVTDDITLTEQLEEILASSESSVERFAVGAKQTPTGPGSILAVDFDPSQTTTEELSDLCRNHQGVPVLCILDDVRLGNQAYAAGVAAVVPRDPAAISDCFASLARFQAPARINPPPRAKPDYQKLHRMVADLRSGVFSASVALSLMKVISESVERAVLFLVKGEFLTALGAFGFDTERHSLAEQTRGLQLQIAAGDGFSRAISERRALTLPLEAAQLSSSLLEAMGPPVHPEIAIFPVLGVDRVILVVYADNGSADRGIEEIEILDLAAAEVGIAFENELLRRQLSKRG